MTRTGSPGRFRAKAFLAGALGLLVLLAGSCSTVARAGVRYVHTDSDEVVRHGGEAVVSLDIGDQVGVAMKDTKDDVPLRTPSFGFEGSLGYIHDEGGFGADRITGSGLFTVSGNLFRTFSKQESYVGVRLTGGIGFRVFDSDADFALQGNLQVLVGTFRDGSLMLEGFIGYLPGDEVLYFGVGLSIASFDHGGKKEVVFGVR